MEKALKMKKKSEQQLKEENEFIESMLRSLDDIKHGRVHKFRFSEK